MPVGESLLHCIVCETQGEWLYKGLKDTRFGRDGDFNLRRCPQCGLLWQDPRHEWREILDFHDDLFVSDISQADQSEQEKNPLALLKEAVRENILCGYYGYRHLHKDHSFCFLGKLLGFVPILRTKSTRDFEGLFPRFKKRSGCLVVDVGCGEGAYLEFMRKMGWDVFGIEPHPKAVHILKQKGIPVFQGVLKEAKLKDESADLVTLKHVLEHVPDPLATINECFRILKKGGSLVIHTPNAESLGVKIFGKNCFHLDQPRHLYIFSRRSMRLLFEKTEFRKFYIRTLLKTAKNVYNGSTIVATKGRFDPKARTSRIGRLLFYLREAALMFFGMGCGEEIEAVAVK